MKSLIITRCNEMHHSYLEGGGAGAGEESFMVCVVGTFFAKFCL